MSLVEAAKQLLYNHPPFTAKRDLMKLIEMAEAQYLVQIDELETEVARLKRGQKQDEESGRDFGEDHY